MSAPIVQANYQQLDDIARRFTTLEHTTIALQQQLLRAFAPLEAGDWQGRGSTAFIATMRTEVFVAVSRLINALETGHVVMVQNIAILRDAEERAAAVYGAQGDNWLSHQVSYLHGVVDQLLAHQKGGKVDPNAWLDKYLGPKAARVIVDPKRALRRFYDDSINDLESDIAKRQQELRDNDVPVNNKHDTTVYGPKSAVGTVLLNATNRKVIEDMAKRYDIPADVLMGVIASEMDFDLDQDDYTLDGLGRQGIEIGEGQGVASVHKDTLIKAKEYLKEHNLTGTEDAQNYNMGVKNRSSFNGSVESAAIVIKALEHYKGGVKTAEDKAALWGAYRNGVEGFSPAPKDGTYGYGSQTDFQKNIANGTDSLPDRLKIGRNAYMSTPYFSFFERALKLKNEAEDRNTQFEKEPFVPEHRA